MFKLKHLGIYWTQPRTENGGTYSAKKCCMHYEIDRSDEHKGENIITYFNKYSKNVDEIFLGLRWKYRLFILPFLTTKRSYWLQTMRENNLWLDPQLKALHFLGSNL